MPRRFKEARQFKNLKVTEAAEKLGISRPTLSAWEGGRKSPTLDNLEHMADLYGVTTDFLLGRADKSDFDAAEPVCRETLSVMDGKPVWTAKYGWLLVSAATQQFVCYDGNTLPFESVGDVFIAPPMYAEPAAAKGRIISKIELTDFKEIWVEPISSDSLLRNELRGWYKVGQRYAENEYGNRFYFDTYGAKWLALTDNQ